MPIHIDGVMSDNSQFDAANFKSTTLSTSIAIAQTSVQVSDSTVWPTLEDGHFFIAVITHATDNTKKEVVKVTAISGDTWTIVRQYEGNQSFAFPAESSIENRFTAGTFAHTRGVMPKLTTSANTDARPFSSYLAAAGHTVKVDETVLQDGDVVRVTALATDTNAPVLVTDSADATLITLTSAGSWAEFIISGGAAVLSCFHRTPERDYEVYTADFDIVPALRALPNMAAGSNIVASLADGFADGTRFVLNLSSWDKSLTGVSFLLQLGTEVISNGTDEFTSLRITEPCVLPFEKIGGKWYVDGGLGAGSYYDLEARVSKIEDPTQTQVYYRAVTNLIGDAVPVKFTRFGNIVCVSWVVAATWTIADATDLVNIPDGYKPVSSMVSMEFPSSAVSGSASTAICRWILPSQTVFRSYGWGISAIAPRFHAVYITNDVFPTGDEV